MNSTVGEGSGEVSGPLSSAAVLFDLDGTLVDSALDIAGAINAMLAELGLPRHPPNRILDWVGEGSVKLVNRALSGGGRFREAHAAFLSHYERGICVHSTLYPMVTETLERCRSDGVRTACVTNKPEHLSRLLLDALGLEKYFPVVIGGDTLPVRKPDPEPLLCACRVLQVLPSAAVYVGDSSTDYEAASAAGLPFVGVSYGYRRGVDLTKLPGAVIIDCMSELPSAALRLKLFE